MDIREFRTADLIPYDNNPRKNEKAVEIVMKSIQEFGFKVPIVIDENKVIIAGHTRLKAAQRMGLEKVPCLIADDLTPEQIKAFRLVDNKTSEYAEWDLERLEQELLELKALDFDFGAFDFKLQDEAKEDDFDLEEALAEIGTPRTNVGDVWALGQHRLVCGDSTKKDAIEYLMNGKQAQLVITDPPYNVDYESATTDMKIMNDKMTDQKFRAFLLDSFKVMIGAMAPGAPIYVFHADTEGVNFRNTFREAGFKLSQLLIWVKSSLVPGYSDYQWRPEPIIYGWKEGSAHRWYGDRTNSTVHEDLKIKNPSSMKKAELVEYVKELQEKDYAKSTVVRCEKPTFNDAHPTMKPVKLIGKLMTNSSAHGNLVLDPFGGSGSTLIAAEQLGRICYTMELDPKYCDVIVKRWEEYTGGTATRYKHG